MSTQRPKVLAIVLAGGEGKRLMPLTADRAKPGVPFAGIYRLIDFALSNVVNSGYLQVVVLTQYKSHSLDRHVSQTWRMSSMLGNYVSSVPAQQRVGKHWYMGSADAIFQSLNLLRDEQPDIVVVVGADHVYRMDFSQMVDQHIDSGAACTVAAIRQPIKLADQFGVIDVQPDEPSRIREFLEKPTDPVGLPDSPDEVLASMGNYVFDADALVEAVTRDSETKGSKHDMGGDIVPSASSAAPRPASTTTRTTTSPARPTATAATGATSGRWRRTTPPTWTSSHRCRSSTSTTSRGRSTPPTARSRPPSSSRAPTAPRPASTRRCSRPVSSSPAASSGTRCSRPRSGWSPARPSRGRCCSTASRSGTGAQVRNAIIDKNVVVPPGATVGVDHAADEARGFIVQDGLTVLARTRPSPPRCTPASTRGSAASPYAAASDVDRVVRVQPARVRHHPQLGAGQIGSGCRPVRAPAEAENAVR